MIYGLIGALLFGGATYYFAESFLASLFVGSGGYLVGDYLAPKQTADLRSVKEAYPKYAA